MNKPRTLLGYVGEAVKNIDEITEDGKSNLVSAEDVKQLIAEVVNETFLNSLKAESSEPTEEILDGKPFFFANGTPITIEAVEGNPDAALIKWEGGEKEVNYKTNVFGGRHYDDTLTNTSVIMNGGKVNSISGGGLHKSHTVKSMIQINDGYVKNVYGGGAASFIKACGHPWNTDINNCDCITESALVEINGGEGMFLVFGGGEGISYTKKTLVVVNNEPSIYYVTAAGANGKTDECKAEINGGKITVLQGINRGEIGSAEVVINGGKIEKAFVGGEIPFIGSKEKPNGNDPSGVFKKASMTINGGKVGEVSLGGNDYEIITEESPCFTNTTLVVK